MRYRPPYPGGHPPFNRPPGPPFQQYGPMHQNMPGNQTKPSMDFPTIVNNVDQVVKTVNQISPMVKQLSPLLSLFKK